MVVDISKSLAGEADWALDSRFLQVMNSNTNFEPYMRSVVNQYRKFNSSILNSLKTSMKVVDEF